MNTKASLGVWFWPLLTAALSVVSYIRGDIAWFAVWVAFTVTITAVTIGYENEKRKLRRHQYAEWKPTPIEDAPSKAYVDGAFEPVETPGQPQCRCCRNVDDVRLP